MTPKFTMPAMAAVPEQTPPSTPPNIIEYVSNEEVIVDDYDYDTSSDDGSLTSSAPAIDDLDDDFIQEQQDDSRHAGLMECSIVD